MADEEEQTSDELEGADAQEEEEKSLKLLSDSFGKFKNAIEVLYIRGNASGRNHFSREWPVLSEYLFEPDLIAFDQDGVESAEDKEQRAALETLAEEKQRILIDVLDAVEENSASDGTLQTEYVEGIIKDFGRDISLLIYTEKIVNRFAPAPKEEEKSVAEPETAPTVKETEPTTQPPSAAPPAPRALSEAPPAPSAAEQDAAQTLAHAEESMEDSAEKEGDPEETEESKEKQEPKSVSGKITIEKKQG